MTFAQNRNGSWIGTALVCATLALTGTVAAQAPASDTPPESVPAAPPEGEAAAPPEMAAEPAPAPDPAPEAAPAPVPEPVPERAAPSRPKPAAPKPAAPRPAPIPAVPARAAPASPAPVTGLNPQELLASHNELRARHGAPAMTWSAALQQEAQSWADRCLFLHSQTANGENLSWWSAPESAGQRVQNWYNEIADYDFAHGVSKNGKPVGHFTQIVWRGTSALGCAIAACDGGQMLVCQYSPAGNVQSQYQANVTAAAP